MQIPPIASTTMASTTIVAKSQLASSPQNTTKQQTKYNQDMLPIQDALSTTIKLPGQSIQTKSQASAPGMNADLFNSLLQTSLKINSIRNDPTIPENAKRKLLGPLEQANNTILSIAEQEQKSEIAETANRRAEKIQKAGEEKNMQPAAPSDSTILDSADEVTSPPKVATTDSVAQAPTPTLGASYPIYSPSVPTLGENINTHA